SMTLNLIVPSGAVRFVLFDGRDRENFSKSFQEVTLSIDNYSRLTIPPRIWFGFQGKSKNINIVLNIADIEHDPIEAEQKAIHEINFDWGI
ncbi:MAG: dTDP-4-dehydrorhamnose 3,5-epimerase, partial [Desulfobacteraceae bacterium]|nr:dTDP-4-dehydrorhamnose 3,5-epimerase [Desulfobacteraceae bacterium]